MTLAVIMLTLAVGMAIGAAVTLAVEIAWLYVARRLQNSHRADLRSAMERRPYVPSSEAGVRVGRAAPLHFYSPLDDDVVIEQPNSDDEEMPS